MNKLWNNYVASLNIPTVFMHRNEFEQLYQCPECGLHYEDEQTTKDCEVFCRDNNACSLEITKYSFEAKTDSERTAA